MLNKKIIIIIIFAFCIYSNSYSQIKIDLNNYYKQITNQNLQEFTKLNKGMLFQDFEIKYKINILTTLYDKSKEENKQIKIVIMSRKIIDVNVIEVFSFIFIDDKLVVWGNIDDLKRSKNKEIQEITNKAAKKLYLGVVNYD